MCRSSLVHYPIPNTQYPISSKFPELHLLWFEMIYVWNTLEKLVPDVNLRKVTKWKEHVKFHFWSWERERKESTQLSNCWNFAVRLFDSRIQMRQKDNNINWREGSGNMLIPLAFITCPKRTVMSCCLLQDSLFHRSQAEYLLLLFSLPHISDFNISTIWCLFDDIAFWRIASLISVKFCHWSRSLNEQQTFAQSFPQSLTLLFDAKDNWEKYILGNKFISQDLQVNIFRGEQVQLLWSRSPPHLLQWRISSIVTSPTAANWNLGLEKV